MNREQLLSHVDHTLLKPESTWEQIRQLCEDAISYKTASVCVPPCYVRRIHDTYKDRINICTVIGFPLGYCVTEAKECEARKAIEDGACEIDMVVNICEVKNGNWDFVKDEIRAVKEACGGHILKVIIETCYLSESEKIRLCRIVTDAGADYIKTSTGFGTAGATHEDIRLFRENIGPYVKIKAAGGITTIDDMEQYLEEGCDRIGTSRAVGLLKNS
ncbi:MAG: deoxyribose-phosphate aldolase [Lachnospiraceae bacterium]|nr:deoxyribose-phosphate aldolase [Lachnospiraceae bacterium]